MLRLTSFAMSRAPACFRLHEMLSYRNFHASGANFGLEEFFDPKVEAGQVVVTGRGWTVPELRKKSWEDLHKLYYVLYKERNLLLTDKEKSRKFQRAVTPKDEMRYTYVKRAMGGIKIVIQERKRLGLHEEDIAMKKMKEQGQVNK